MKFSIQNTFADYITEAIKMQLAEQFGLKKPLDLILQLIYMSTQLFSSFEFRNNVGFIKLHAGNSLSKSERKILLTHFLDLIRFFSYEELNLIQDPQNSNCYALTGIHGGI